MSDVKTRDLERAAAQGDPAALAAYHRELVRTGKRVEFFIAQLPKQKGNSKRIMRTRAGTPFIASSAKDKKAEETLGARAYEHRPAVPLTGPVRLDVTFVMPIPTSMPKWKLAAALAGHVHPAKRPDRGNLLKLVEDALEGPFYGDDAQIVAGDVKKAYGATPGYRIVLEQIEEPETREGFEVLLERELHRTLTMPGGGT